jgi:rubrerythrin
MKKPDTVCPQCNSSKEVYKVSEIYLSGLESIKSSSPQKENAFDRVFGHPSQKLGRRFVDQTIKRNLVSKFAPPSSSKQRISRSLSPDFIMGATFLLSMFMLYQIFTQQREVFLSALLIILAVGAAYLLTRKRIVVRFIEKQKNEARHTVQIKEAIERWMNLYYCAADFIVFDKKNRIPIPLQEMNNYLMSPEIWLNQAVQDE